MKRGEIGTITAAVAAPLFAAVLLGVLVLGGCETTQLSPEEQAALDAERAALAEVIVGDWEGEISAEGQSYPVVFHITTDRNGALYSTMDSPSQGVYGFRVDRTRFDGTTLTLEVREARFSYEGTISPDGQTVNGVFEQAGYSGDTTLTRVP
jgi:hypothetical protein